MQANRRSRNGVKSSAANAVASRRAFYRTQGAVLSRGGRGGLGRQAMGAQTTKDAMTEPSRCFPPPRIVKVKGAA